MRLQSNDLGDITKRFCRLRGQLCGTGFNVTFSECRRDNTPIFVLNYICILHDYICILIVCNRIALG